MNWIEVISSSLKYIETHIKKEQIEGFDGAELTVERIAREVSISPFYLQKSFSLICGISISEYIRNRRLSIAGRDIQRGERVLDVALKYGYESADSFTKAFQRLHGISPNQLRNGTGQLKYYFPLQLHIETKGGFEMNCRIVNKGSFSLVGFSKYVPNESGYQKCPEFWNEHYLENRNQIIVGKYGVCIDEGEVKGHFQYVIADDYQEEKEYPQEVVKFEIPAHTWAVFPCVGSIPNALQSVNKQIFTDWLPSNPEYEIDCALNIECYSDASLYPMGTMDEKYYCEIWIPVKEKQ